MSEGPKKIEGNYHRWKRCAAIAFVFLFACLVTQRETMVKLAPEYFADAAAQMRAHGGVERTRMALKIRHRDGVITAKATDGTTTLSTRIANQSDFRSLERIVTEYVNACTVFAAASTGDEGKSGKKGKKKK